jgi:hypothetical protein
MLDAANTAGGNSENNSVSDVVRKLGEVIIDPLIPRGRPPINQNQAELVNTFGKEMTPELMKLVGTRDKPSNSEMLIKINAARMLSILGRSGYEGVADGAVEILKNADQSDAVKLYALEALKNLFAVPKRNYPERSVFSKPDPEAAAISALVDFIARKPAITPETAKDEVDAFRYLRREAVRALGMVRKPVVRNQNVNGGIITIPALWLLRVANADTSLVPSPSLSERVEGLVGYLRLNPDKDQNMDYASAYVASAVQDIAREYKERKILEKPKPEDKATAVRLPEERDYLPWKTAANRLQVAIKDWQENWEANVPAGNRPENIQRMVREVAIDTNEDILSHIIAGNQTEQVVVDRLRVFLSNSQFNSTSLYTDDKGATITRPDAGR